MLPGYVLFDSWSAWPGFIKGIRSLNNTVHVICRLKDSKVHYEYKEKKYRLSELYQKVKNKFRKDVRTGLWLARVSVKLPDAKESCVIIFSKGYQEPETDLVKGKKKAKEPKWVAFLSTNIKLHASSIIKKYIKRWAVEVYFKESKQILQLGKDQSNTFNSQVFAETASMLRYNFLNYLNETENHATLGELFEHLADDSLVVTYAHRLWDFFKDLFCVSFSTIFDLFKIEEDFQPYLSALNQAITGSIPFRGCET